MYGDGSFSRSWGIGQLLSHGGVTTHLPTLLSKLCLLASSLALIRWLSGGLDLPAFLLLAGLAGYVLVSLADRLADQRVRGVVAGGGVMAAFCILAIANWMGWIGTLTGRPDTLGDQLPILVGASFYALHMAGIHADVMRRAIARPTLLDYMVSVTLVLKFYSGPLEKGAFAQQVRDFQLRWDDQALAAGLPWVVLGLFMKFCISDPLVTLANVDATAPLQALACAFIYELRVYFNFAGYSFAAYGLARCLGLNLTLNFVHPLFAPNVRVFWQRWHVSLGRWLHAYVYQPLRPYLPAHPAAAPMLGAGIFLVSAGWHGMTVNFLLWGLFHAACYLAYLLWFSRRSWSPWATWLVMPAFLLFARLLYVDDDTARLFAKLANLVDPAAWAADIAMFPEMAAAVIDGPKRALLALVLAAGVLALERVGLSRHPDQPYALLRSRRALLLMGLVMVFTSTDLGQGLVYARQ